jgi:hypothetical protein
LAAHFLPFSWSFKTICTHLFPLLFPFSFV